MIKLGMRIAVIAIFVLNGAALTLGIILFQQRETLKGRTQKLEKTIKEVAATIEAGDATNATVTIPDDQLKTFRQKPGGPAPMDGPLGQLTLAAQNQLTRLNGTRTVLEETKTALAKTEEDLKTTQTNLATAKAEIGVLHETVTSKNSIIEARDSSIKNLERDKVELNAKIAADKVKIDAFDSEKAELMAQITQRDAEIKKLKLAQTPDGKPKLTKGQHGEVLYVDPDWNFMIIGIAAESRKTIGPDMELLVRRADRMVGKVRIKAVENDMAIADIMSDWQQMIPRKGDSVLN
jgi:hypothetical protein